MKNFKISIFILATLFWNSIQAQWLTTGNPGITTTNFLGSTNNEFLRVRTNNLFRMKINPNISYQVNQLPTQNRNGYVLIGNDGFSSQSNRTLAANNWGAFSAALASIAKRNLRV
ncbi:MAG: hypothetical protein U0T32_04875 [Chitinophagales bacterium]